MVHQGSSNNYYVGQLENEDGIDEGEYFIFVRDTDEPLETSYPTLEQAMTEVVRLETDA